MGDGRRRKAGDHPEGEGRVLCALPKQPGLEWWLLQLQREGRGKVTAGRIFQAQGGFGPRSSGACPVGYSLKASYSYDRRASVGLTLYPQDHRPGMKVPKGGSSCSTCKALSEDGKHCANSYFQAWQKSLGVADPSLIPAPADAYCSDWYLPKDGALRGV